MVGIITYYWERFGVGMGIELGSIVGIIVLLTCIGISE
jgi:hypothetical protein